LVERHVAGWTRDERLDYFSPSPVERQESSNLLREI
jgi:hypothetical protein